MNRFLSSAVLLPLLFASSAYAGIEGRYVESLRDHGYSCGNTPAKDGTLCVKKGSYTTYVVVPNNLASHTHDVFYAHGLVGVCGHGASGENYLENESPTLRRIGAISIMPLRPSAAATGFPLTSYLAGVEEDLGGDKVPLIVSGHSAAGGFLGRELEANPEVMSRVDQVLLIDAIYAAPNWASLWVGALKHAKSNLEMKLVSSTTAAASREFVSILKPHDSNISLEIKGEPHCQMPKYFDELQ